MKRIFSILLFAFCLSNTYAQMDEKFYHPDKEWLKIDSLQYHEIVLYADTDTIHSILFKT